MSASVLPETNVVERPLVARSRAMRVIAQHEYRTVVRGRIVLAFAILFIVLALGVTLAGLGASGRLLVQGYTRTAVSLLMPALYLLPLLGVLLGASAFGGEDGSTALLLAQPIERSDSLVGRALGLAAALMTVALAGFGTAGVVVGVIAHDGGLGGFLLVAAGTTLAGCAGLAVGMTIGLLVRRRAAAVGWALAAWFVAAVLYDLLCILVLQLAGSGEVSGWLVALLALNPLDGVRVLALTTLGADVLLGPTGAALRRTLGETGGAAWIGVSLMCWIVVPGLIAARLYGKKDL